MSKKVVKKIEPQSFAAWLQNYLAPFSDKKKRTGITSTYLSVNGRKAILLYYVKMAYFEIFPANGLDPVGYPLNPESQSKYFITAWRVMWTSFFGIPNRVLFGHDKLRKKTSKNPNKNDPDSDLRKELTFEQIFKNFVGWHREDSPRYHKILNYTLIVPLLRGVWKTVKIVGTTAWNTLKLFTEFLPYSLELLCYRKIANYKKLFDDYSQSPSLYWKEMTGCIVGMALLGVSYYVFKTWRLLGRTITSPGESIRHSWHEGNKLEGIKGKIVGGVLAFVSGVLTVAIYTILFPLGIKAVIAHAPSFVSAVVGKVSAWAESSTFVRRLGEGILKVVQPFVDGIRKTFNINSTASSTLSPEVAASTSAFYLSVVVPLNRLMKGLNNWWHRQTTQLLKGKGEGPLAEPLLGEQRGSSSLSASNSATQTVSNINSALNSANAAGQSAEHNRNNSISTIPVPSTTLPEDKSSEDSEEKRILSLSDDDSPSSSAEVANNV